MRKVWSVLLVLVVLLAASVLAACGATTTYSEPTPGYMVKETVMVEAAPAPTSAAAPTAAPAAVVAQAGDASVPRAQTGRMIVKNAEMELLVADTDGALDGVTAVAAEYGGYIVSSHTWFEGEFKYASVRLGVPVGEFENVLRRLRGLAVKVNSETASGEDVTDQYVDLESQLTNLKATQARIREFLERAQTVEEALKVNEQLSEIEGKIEQIQGQMNYLRDRSAYSTISVQLVPQRPTPTPTLTPTPTPTPTPVAWQPGKTVVRATNTLGSLLKGLVELLIWLVVVLGPFLLPIIVVVWLVIRSRRRAGKRRGTPAAPTAPAAGE